MTCRIQSDAERNRRGSRPLSFDDCHARRAEFCETNPFPASLILLTGMELKTQPGNDFGYKFLCIPRVQNPVAQLKVATLVIYTRFALQQQTMPVILECDRVYTAKIDRATKGIKPFLDSRLCLIVSESRAHAQLRFESIPARSTTHYLLYSPCFVEMVKQVFKSK